MNTKAWLNSLSIAKNTIKKLYGTKNGVKGSDLEILNGELRIENFPELEKLNLDNVRELDKLIISNCPKLKKVKVQNSGVQELELGTGLDELTFLDFSFETDAVTRPHKRKLDTLDLKNVPNLKVLLCFGVHETKLKGVENLIQLQQFDSHSRGSKAVTLPTEDFREWKEGVKKVLGITTEDLPDTWQTDLVNKLGGVNLAQIPSGKTLKDLIDDLSADKDDLQKRLDQAQEELDKWKDYEEIKQERDQLKQQLAAIKGELGLGNDATGEQVLIKIEELKNTPPGCSHPDYEATKAERDALKNEIENKNLQIAELENKNKENVGGVITKKTLVESTKTNLKKWGIEVLNDSKLQTAATAQNVEQIRNEIISSEFNRLKDEKNSAYYLNLGLGAITLGSLTFIVWMAMSQNNNLLKTEPEKKKE